MTAPVVRSCSHGFAHPASCIDCMADGPVFPPRPTPEQVLAAGLWVYAREEGRCARRRSHRIYEGDPIGHVDDLGWCCAECVR